MESPLLVSITQVLYNQFSNSSDNALKQTLLKEEDPTTLVMLSKDPLFKEVLSEVSQENPSRFFDLISTILNQSSESDKILYPLLFLKNSEQIGRFIHQIEIDERRNHLFLSFILEVCKKNKELEIKNFFVGYVDYLEKQGKDRTGGLEELFLSLNKDLFSSLINKQYRFLPRECQAVAFILEPTSCESVIKKLKLECIAQILNISLQLLTKASQAELTTKRVLQMINSKNKEKIQLFLEHLIRFRSPALHYIPIVLSDEQIYMLWDLPSKLLFELFNPSPASCSFEMQWVINQYGIRKDFVFALTFDLSVKDSCIPSKWQFQSEPLTFPQMQNYFRNVENAEAIDFGLQKGLQRIPTTLIALGIQEKEHISWISKILKFLTDDQISIFAQALPLNAISNEEIDALIFTLMENQAKVFIESLSEQNQTSFFNYKLTQMSEDYSVILEELEKIENGTSQSSIEGVSFLKSKCSKYSLRIYWNFLKIALDMEEESLYVEIQQYLQNFNSIKGRILSVMSRLQEKEEEEDKEDGISEYSYSFFTVKNVSYFGIDPSQLNCLGICSDADFLSLGISKQRERFLDELEKKMWNFLLNVELRGPANDCWKKIMSLETRKENEFEGLKQTFVSFLQYDYSKALENLYKPISQKDPSFINQFSLNLDNSKDISKTKKKKLVVKIFYATIVYIKQFRASSVLYKYFHQPNLRESWKTLIEERGIRSLTTLNLSYEKLFELSNYLNSKRQRKN